MTDNTASPDGTGGPPVNGDPSLGPNDLCLELEVILASREGVRVQADVSLRLTNALAPAAKDTVAAAIQSNVELMRQSAIAKLSEIILQRCPQPKQQFGRTKRQGRHQDTPRPDPIPASSPQGDPGLGPNDARLKTKLLLVDQKAMLCNDHASVRLPDAWTLPARGAAAAAIDTSIEVLLKNALVQIAAAIESRLPKSQPETNSPLRPWVEKDDFPKVLPLPLKKAQPDQASSGAPNG